VIKCPFRRVALRWAFRAEQLDAEAVSLQAETGGRETFLSANARFTAAVYRLGAALLSAKP
jgi:hypothetical protein